MTPLPSLDDIDSVLRSRGESPLADEEARALDRLTDLVGADAEEWLASGEVD